MLDHEIAYCAGLIDGEGCIRIKRVEWSRYRKDRATPGFHAVVAVKMVERAPLNFLAQILGGTVRPEKRQNKKRKPLFVWSITDLKAENACRLVRPYLRVKHRQADLVLRFRGIQATGASHRTKVVGYRNFPNSHGTPRRIENRCFSDEYVASLEACHLESRQLNKVGV